MIQKNGTLFLFFAAVVLVGFAGVAVVTAKLIKDSYEQQQVQKMVDESKKMKSSADAMQQYSMSEVAKHSIASDCWLVVDATVYNVTEYVTSHPGGKDILRGCGLDATTLFATQGKKYGEHSSAAAEILGGYAIGKL